MKTIAEPVGAKRQLFATKQEAQRKDVERRFGVLQVSVFVPRSCSIETEQANVVGCVFVLCDIGSLADPCIAV